MPPIGEMPAKSGCSMVCLALRNGKSWKGSDRIFPTTRSLPVGIVGRVLYTKESNKPASLSSSFLMFPNHFFYLPQSSSPSSGTTPVAAQSTHHLPPTVYPGASPNYAGYNTNWGAEHVHTLLHVANQMNGEFSSTGAATTANNASHQCRWLMGNIACSQDFANFDELMVHLGHVHDVQGPAARKLVCQWQLTNGLHCGKEYRRDGFRRHIGTHIGLSVPCPDCNKRFSREDSMRSHRRMQHGKA